MPAHVTATWLVLADVNDQFLGTLEGPGCVVTARLDTPLAAGMASHQLGRDDASSHEVQVHRPDGSSVLLQYDEPRAAWCGLSAGVHVEDALRTAEIDRPRTMLAPTMLLTRDRETRSLESYDVYVCTRVREGGLVFTRVGEVTVRHGAGIGEVLDAARHRAAPLSEQISGESHQTHNFEPETEVEAKITVHGRVQPWALACHFGELSTSRAIPGHVPDLGNEMQRWHYRQETFEVLSPEAERGYIAFIHKRDHHYLLKQKTYAEDGLRRREVFDFDVHLPSDDFEGHLERTFPGMLTRRLPSMTRSRFDVNVESQATGHFYGIEVDEVVVADSDRTLRQVEIEYHHSRVHAGLTPDLIEREVLWLRDFVSAQLASDGIEHRVDFYSKLSFLRDCVGDASFAR